MPDVVGEPVVDPTLLPDCAAWLAVNPAMNLQRYAYPLVRLDHFFAIGSILWPQLISHQSGLFLAEEFSVTNFERWQILPMDLTSIERVMNHRHMRDLLKSFSDASWPILVSAAALIKNCWEARLNQLCPDIATKVQVYQSDRDVEVTFFTVRP